VRVHALVLAAGQGRRFGGNKLLSQYRGKSLIAHVLELVAAARKRGVVSGGLVTVASEDDAVRELCTSAGLEAVLNHSPELGLSYSLQLGLGALGKLSPDESSAALVFLGDQPLVRLDVVEQLMAEYRRHPTPVLRPRYRECPDVPGHPTLLDRSIWHLARNLQGDRGIAGLLLTHPVETRMIDMLGNNPDVDTLADLVALEEQAP
jgi:molybdenum cofactor cytidylyltransferase